MTSILITRPTGRQHGLQQALSAAGYQVRHYPVLAIQPLQDDDPVYQHAKAKVLDLDHYQHVIFISMNAVEYGVEWIDQYWPQLPVQQRYYAIGQATAAALQTKGLTVEGQGVAAMDSEELLATTSLQAVAGQKILIVRGVGGRQQLANILRQRGAEVEYLECYRRSLPNKTDEGLAEYINKHQIDMICANSGESLLNLCQLYGEPMAGLISQPVVVPGKRVAAIAREMGFKCVVEAENAGTHATLKAIQCHSITDRYSENNSE